MDQGEINEGASKILHFSDQVALEPDANSDMGVSVVHAGDIRGQMQAALANIDAVLQEAGMERSNIISSRFYHRHGRFSRKLRRLRRMDCTGQNPPAAKFTRRHSFGSARALSRDRSNCSELSCSTLPPNVWPSAFV